MNTILTVRTEKDIQSETVHTRTENEDGIGPHKSSLNPARCASERSRKKKRRSLSKKKRFEVFKRDSFTCQYCGAKAPDVVLQCDHIKPVSKGGTDDILNLITSCLRLLKECLAAGMDLEFLENHAKECSHWTAWEYELEEALATQNDQLGGSPDAQ